MYAFFGITSFLVGIPESLGLLAFGLVLSATAIFIRWLFARAEAAKDEKELDKKLTR